MNGFLSENDIAAGYIGAQYLQGAVWFSWFVCAANRFPIYSHYIFDRSKAAVWHIQDGFPDLFSAYHAQDSSKCRLGRYLRDPQPFDKKFFPVF